jgi:lambda repressor-like predicted transcriptional regulator
MVRRPKFIATRTRKVLADNVRSRMEERFKNEPDMVRALSEQSGVSRSTVQRVLNADMIGASIDTLTQMANALHCDPYELLLPERFPNHHHRRFDNQKPNLEL